MNPPRSAHARKKEKAYPRSQADQIKFRAEVELLPLAQPRFHRWRNVIMWSLLPITIASTMQACGMISLVGATKMVIEDTRAKIQADYSLWEPASFLLVDPAILDQIAMDTGHTIALHTQGSNIESIRGTPPVVMETIIGDDPTITFTPSGTPATTMTSPTATQYGDISTTATATATLPPSATPPPSVTPPASATPPAPTATLPGNRYYLYTSTPQAPDPTTSGGQDHGSGK